MSVPCASESQPAVKTVAAQLDPRLADLYREHFQFVWRNARRLGAEDAWVDDVVHEVFLVVGRRLGDFEGRSSVRTWLFSITYRAVQSFRRSRNNYRRQLQKYTEVGDALGYPQPQQRSEASHELHRLLARLGEAKRLVFILSDLEGLTTREVAECLSLPAGTVSTRLRAARHELRTMLSSETIDAGRPDP